MPQIAIRLSDEELAGLDRLVAERHFASRAAAIRDALAQVQKTEEDRRIAEAYERAYGGRPPTQEEMDLGETGLALLAEFYRGEPPWDEPADDEAPANSALDEVESAAMRILEAVRRVRPQGHA